MWRAAVLSLVVTGACAARADITSAGFADPTTRYDHAILGDNVEYGALVMQLSDGGSRQITLPPGRVFEDLAPRLTDLNGDGAPEVIVVETDLARGARLSVYGVTGLIAATPFIGQSHRWLAPIGAGDLDGDGQVEIAYIDRPHLVKTLHLWRFENGALTPVADLAGLTNHRIGQDFISGGIRNCGQGPQIITANADWSRLMAISLSEGLLSARAIGSDTSQAGFTAAMSCR